MKKPLITYTTSGRLTADAMDILHCQLNGIATVLGAEFMIVDGGATVSVTQDLTPILEALERIEENTRHHLYVGVDLSKHPSVGAERAHDGSRWIRLDRDKTSTETI